ncbi:MAG: AMP-dependent synthetase/ligase [Armatimonadota bacterium]
MTATLSPPSTAPGVTSLREAGDLSRRPKPMTAPQAFQATVRRHGDRVALRYKVDGEWRPITYREMGERVRRLALGLHALGVRHGARVALLSENRPEWAVTDQAVLSLGAVNVPLYSTLPPPQVEYIAADAGAEVLIVSHGKQLEKVLAVRDRLTALRHVVVMDPPEPLPEGVLTFAEVLERGGAVPGGSETLERLAAAVKPEDLASIIYTSGTTGAPKGAMLTHDNFISNAQTVVDMVDVTENDTFLSFLPLSHVFERMAGHYLPLQVGATIAYAESVFTVQSNMVEINPTIMASVPRLYESMHSRIQDGIAKQPERKRKLAEWAVKVGWERNSRTIEGKSPGLLTALQYAIADRLVLKPLRERVTGTSLRFFISGGAPLPVETAKFIASIGLRILEGYGLTETSPVICVNLPEKTRIGTVGPPIPGVQVRIAEDGEILSRGPHIMQGYYNLPEETANAIDAEGWFHTGDIGVLDPDGYLRITDRKKDLIVLANGKNVAPQPIEAKVKASPYINTVVLFGDRQPQVVALIVPAYDRLKNWAKERGIEGRDPEALSKHPDVKKLLRKEIDEHTQDLADFEKIRRFAILTEDFTMEKGELTPTLKIKRKVVAEHYADEVRSLYGGARADAG